MSGHTPGPWIDWATLEWIHDPQRLLTRTEDARLIAVAPEMLAELRRLAIRPHVRMTYGGGTTPNGGSCEVCRAEWAETSTEYHNVDCIIARAEGSA